MLPQEPGVFSRALMGLAGPEDPEMGEMEGMSPEMAPPMGDPMPPMAPMDAGLGAPPPGMGGMDPMMGMAPPEEPMEEASAEETRVVEDLIRNYLYEQGRKRMEATRQYQENVATANSELF